MGESQSGFKDHLTPISMRTRCRMLPRMARFIIPLSLVYLFEYFINQGVVSVQLLLVIKSVTNIFFQ